MLIRKGASGRKCVDVDTRTFDKIDEILGNVLLKLSFAHNGIDQFCYTTL